ncbi:transporter [Salinibacillus xinjiangensis]|uniref:Transporter n=1 Tax=Salinibacillus xinjiangensis TaxID=1229268 RepID=A0A6G1X8Z0_9BACI|nr:transporter [Salinibacillus xinjiangensis]MRG87471.1 transporter [Salinibacillus xinjiangensis]
MQRVMKTIYEGTMILLVMMTIITLWTEDTYNSTINWIVWAVFFADFVIRLFLNKDRWGFIKQNPFLLIAVIPFDQFFQIARIVRVIYLFRIKTITKYYITPYAEKLTYKSRTIIVFILSALLLIEAIILWTTESTVTNFFDGLYVVFGYLMFFGHRIFEIENLYSIWALTATSVVGIVIQGLALQWVFTKIEGYYRSIKDAK